VSDTLVQKMSGHILICLQFGPFVKSLDIFGHIYNVRSVRTFMEKKFEMSGQNKSLDISGQSANVRTSEPKSKGSGKQPTIITMIHDAAE
jgi:hypothetical protein